jgi:hypothetical protein
MEIISEHISPKLEGQEEGSLDSFTQISEFWRQQDLKQGLGSTQESDYKVLRD